MWLNFTKTNGHTKLSNAASKRFTTLVQTHTGHFREEMFIVKLQKFLQQFPLWPWLPLVGIRKVVLSPCQRHHRIPLKTPRHSCASGPWMPSSISGLVTSMISRETDPKRPFFVQVYHISTLGTLEIHNTFSYISRFPPSVAHLSNPSFWDAYNSHL